MNVTEIRAALPDMDIGQCQEQIANLQTTIEMAKAARDEQSAAILETVVGELEARVASLTEPDVEELPVIGQATGVKGQASEVEMDYAVTGEIDATNAARELAEEYNIDLADVEHDGQRITKPDVQAMIDAGRR